MNIKEQKAEEYCYTHVEHMDTKTAFEAGWEAALEHLSSLSYDEAVETILGEMEE